MQKRLIVTLALAAYALLGSYLGGLPGYASASDKAGQAPLAQLLTKRGYIEVPLTRLRDGYLIVPARINGKAARLLVDTGAACTFLDSEGAEAFRVTQTSVKG